MHSRARIALIGLGAACVAAAAFYLGGFFFRPAPLPPAPHRSFLMEKAYFDDAFSRVSTKCPKGVRGAIVNHHLIAKEFIADTLSCLDPKARVVVLLSPDHFSAGIAPIVAPVGDWDTPYGRLRADVPLIQALAARTSLRVDDAPFGKEHGIGNIVAFLKHAAPKAEVVPIIFKDSASDADVDALAAALDKALPKDAVVVTSVDFSHELTPVAARHADEKSLSVIERGEADRIKPLDIDSGPALRLALDLMKARGTQRFMLTHHSNSSDETGQDLDDTTSHVTGVFTPGPPSDEKSVSVLMMGDVMLARQVASKIRQHGFAWLFDPLHRLLWGSDAVVANLEGAFSNVTHSATDPTSLSFVFDPALAPKLKAAGFTDFSLANNHANNAGGEGVQATRALLEKNGLGWFGDASNSDGNVDVVERGGMRVAFIGYHAFQGGFDRVVAEVKRMKTQADRVVVMAHWGVEYQDTPTSQQQAQAHALIDAGADVVVGAHPHVVQPVETYKRRAIFYSLGNFIFDQPIEAARKGMALGIVFTPEETRFSLMPVESHDTQASLSPKSARDTMLAKIGVPSGEFTLPENP